MEDKSFEEYMQRKAEITGKHDRRIDIIDYSGFGACITGVIGGLILMVAGATCGNRFNSYRNNPEVLRYQSAVETLNALRADRERLFPELSYQPDNVKTHLDNIISERKNQVASLDRAIELVEEDVKEMEETPELRSYEKRKFVLTEGIGFGGLASIIIGFASLLPSIYLSKMLWRKRDKEVEEFEKKEKAKA